MRKAKGALLEDDIFLAEVGLHFQDLGSIKGAAHVPPPAIDLSQLKNMMI